MVRGTGGGTRLQHSWGVSWLSVLGADPAALGSVGSGAIGSSAIEIICFLDLFWCLHILGRFYCIA